MLTEVWPFLPITDDLIKISWLEAYTFISFDSLLYLVKLFSSFCRTMNTYCTCFLELGILKLVFSCFPAHLEVRMQQNILRLISQQHFKMGTYMTVICSDCVGVCFSSYQTNFNPLFLLFSLLNHKLLRTEPPCTL